MWLTRSPPVRLPCAEAMKTQFAVIDGGENAKHARHEIQRMRGELAVSAVPSGNHYLTDVAGGLVVAAMAILCARPIHAALDRLLTGRRLRMMEPHNRSLEL
jgi:hypothetical protein